MSIDKDLFSNDKLWFLNVLNSGLDDKDSLLSKPSRDPSLLEEKMSKLL